MKIIKTICVILAIVMICMAAACDSNSDGGAGVGGSEPGDSGNSGGSAVTNSPGGNTSSGAENTGDVSSGNSGGNDAELNGNENAGADTGDSDPNAGAGSENAGSENAGSGLTGAPEDILSKLTEDLTDEGIQMPMSLPPMKVEAEMSQNTIGLSEADFEKYVADCAYTMAAIGTFAHQMIVIQAKDAGAAGEIKKLVSGDNGYDAKKWICVFPEKAIAVDSGAYVLIVASYAEVADAAVEAFKAAAGSIGEVNMFWEFAGEAGEGTESGAPGGLILG